MIVTDYGVVRTLVISSILIAAAVSAEHRNGTKSDNSTSIPQEKEIQVQSSAILVKDASDSKSNLTGQTKFKRAARYDTAASSPWVRVFNRPPGTQTESFYETRGNTSAHTSGISGETWDSFRDNFSSAEEKVAPVTPAPRTDAKVRDILRVRKKAKTSPQTDDKGKVTAESSPAAKQQGPASSQQPPEEDKPAEAEGKQNKGYVVWTSNDGKPNSGWSLDDPASAGEKNAEPSIEQIIPKDGSHWKVVGEGGEEGWQVVDDNGEVEWKIEYDDGEWRVTSTGQIPEDAEWADPEYVWGPPDGALADGDDYNAWAADDYRLPAPDYAYDAAPEKGNDSWPQQDEEQGKQLLTPGNKEPLQYGTRRKAPPQNINPSSAASSVEERTDPESYESSADDPSSVQNDQGYIAVKSWVPGKVAGGKQKWVQGYGTKSWTADDTGSNSATGGETWVETSKNYDPWMPKVPGKQVDQQPPSVDFGPKQDVGIRAWGTGYGSKTWKGNEWDSSIVWNAAGIPYDGKSDGPQRSSDDQKQQQQVWSQPLPSEDDTAPEAKKGRPQQGVVDRPRVKWPGKPYKGAGRLRRPPSRRTEAESWGDDNTFAGVVWKQDNADDGPSTTSKAPESSTKSPESGGWPAGVWKGNPSPDDGNPPPATWKSKFPKVSNLVSVSWNAGSNPLDSAVNPWSQGQWVDTDSGPTWIFDGCKMTLKCGSRPDTADDSKTKPPTTPDDTSMPTTMPQPVNVFKGWPPKGKGIKSWGPPPKSWRPPPQMQTTTPAPSTPETTTPSMTWRPAPPVYWKKPAPPPGDWKQPPPTDPWTDTTPTLPNISWGPPPQFIKWKKGPKPNKSWRPPPTKSWKPPTGQPMKTWQPPIATPQPDPITKPDCKDPTTPTEAPMQPNVEDDGSDSVEPPQIIIITKVPKGSYPRPDDNGGFKKVPYGPWVFPSRKGMPKSSKNRKDKNINVGSTVKSRPVTPASIRPKRPKSWPKGVPPPKYMWPSNMQRWTTKRPQPYTPWKNPFSAKSKSWRQMFKRWLEGQ